MPLYTYRCSKCKESKEKIVKVQNREESQICDNCNSEMKYEAFTSGDTGSNLYFKELL